MKKNIPMLADNDHLVKLPNNVMIVILAIF